MPPSAWPSRMRAGPPAAGKSTIGRLLADRLGLPLTDTDANIVDRHGVIADIFVTRGQPTTAGSKMLAGYRSPFDATQWASVFSTCFLG